MRFGLFSLLEQPPGADIGTQYRDTLEYFTHGEALGFDDAWIAEHHFHDYGTCGSPATFLCALAMRTTRMRLAPAVSILPLHHPLQLAEDYAMVDVLSGGRLDLCVGRGYQPSELTGFGVDMSETRSRFDEALEILELAWTGEEFSFEGQWHSVDHVRTYPRPIQRPAPPIFLASVSPQTFEMVRNRPRYGIAASLLTSGYSIVRDGLQAFRSSLADGENRPISLVLPAYVGSSDDEALETALRYYRWYFDTVKHLLPGAMGEELDPSYDSYARMAEFAQNVDFVKFAQCFPIGSAKTATAKLVDLLGDVPVDRLILMMKFGDVPFELVRTSMDRMAEEVIPAVLRELGSTTVGLERSVAIG